MENEWELIYGQHLKTLPYLVWKYRILYNIRTLRDLSYNYRETNRNTIVDHHLYHPLLEKNRDGKMVKLAKGLEMKLKKYRCICCY